MVVATVVGIATVGTPAAAQSSCEDVTVDTFRFDNATIGTAANNSASEVVQNTKVTVEQSTAFVRIVAENPNGYCTDVTVELASEIVSPAELGTVDAVDDNTSASWSAMRDFDRQETYTDVTFSLAAGSNATFAPSRVRVQTLQWTGTAKSKASGIAATVSGLISSEPDLQKNTYEYSPEANGTNTITVELTNRTTEKRVEEWQALYQLSDGVWRPVGTDAAAPVYYEQTSGGDAVKFHFDKSARDATLEFTANPGLMAEADYQYKSYTAGLGSITELLGGDGEGWF
jgi:hypothetical protein